MKFILFALLFAVATAAAAETNYVDDVLTITLRTGQGNSYQILRTLTSGTPLEILERGEKYTRVRTADGVEGWVLSQYITPQPIARDRITQMEQRLARFEAENQKFKTDLATLRNEKRTVEGEHKQATGTAEKLQAEVERLKTVAARPLELEKQNQEMRQRLQQLELDARMLTEENTSLRDRTNRDWFLAGAGVLFGGILLGLLVPKLRKRQSWSDWR